ncbi:MAG: hypothetical protein IKN54_08530, partial [Lachnospiraceae bacterium]|nr:hypothetical protein [Lachnospiraceae bacterium]
GASNIPKISTDANRQNDLSVLGGTDAEAAFWGYPVIGTNSWNCLINQYNEMYLNSALISGSTGRYMIGIRAVAIDDTGVLGSWSGAQYFVIDSNIPNMLTASFRNRATGAANSTSDIVRTYVSDMYLSGTQTLIIPVRDQSGIVKVKYDYATTLEGLNVTGVKSKTFEINTVTSDGRLNLKSDPNVSPKDYEVEIPVSVLAGSGPDGLNSSHIVLKVTVFQGNTLGGESTTFAYERYVFNFDNTAPTVDRLQFNGRTYDTDEDTHKVYNSNGSFTIAGKATDEGSGFERFAFYFYKNSAAPSTLGERIYDPVTATTANTASVNQPNFINVNGSGVTYREVTDSTTSSLTAKIYGTEKTMTIANDGITMTGYTSTNTDHINPGSLVEIGGVWYKIASITGGTITLSSPTTLTGSQTVFFAYIMSLDNTETERGTLATESQGDGDKMVESVVKKNTSWEYDAQLYSNYIPDGPKNLRTFVWDKAGNLTIKTYDVQVENNAPRLTKVWLATDLNDNNSFEASEFTAYNILSKTSGNIQSSFNLETGDYGLPRFRVLKDLAVVTEFVGGNAANSGDDIFLAFNNDVTANPDNGKLTSSQDDLRQSTVPGASGSAIIKSTASFESEHSTYSGALARSNKGYVLRNTDLGYTATGYNKDSVKQANGEFTNRAMSFTFWDSTEDTTPGTDSCYCYLKISDLIVLLADNEEPNISIDPFFWNTPDENSLYKNSYLNGHIDLSKDLMSDPTDSSIYVKPKVSGKISVRGSASDAHFLSEIWMKFSNFTVANGLTSSNTPATGAVCVAKRVDGEWTYPTVASTGISGGNVNFRVKKQTSTQQGHYIEWQLDFDTSAMSTGCLENAVLNMWAVDKADTPHHSSGTATTGTTPGYQAYSAVDYNIPNYQMDVVPYISKVQNGSGTTTSDAVRSRLGRYPVKTGQPITIKGFNFPTGNPTVERWGSDGVKKQQITTGVSREDSTTVTMTAPANSGYIKLVWTGAETPNNDNTNAGYNISKGYISSEEDDAGNKTYGRLTANENGTNFWTDDVYLSVWNNTVLPGSTSPWDGKINQIVSKDLINNTYYKNKSGNGIDAVTGALDTWSATWSSPDMIMYTTMGNGDCSKYRTMWQNSQAAFTFPVRTMDWAIIGGKNWYVVRDDYVGNSSANVWGPGLFLGREGFNFPKNGWNSTNQPSDREAYNIIERLGSNMPADTRAPSTGYDSVQEQFQEPHITGWYQAQTHNDGDNRSRPGYTYIYISYYDKFAHCLKYAAYREDWSNSETGSSEKWGSENGSKNLTKLARAADNMTAETVVVAGVDRLFNPASSDFTTANGADCGMYNDIVVDPIDHFPVIIYYNKTTGTLEVAHGNQEAPVTANYKTAAGAFTDTTEGETGWTKTKNITPDSGHDFGRYVSAEVDAKGNIHATAQDFTTGALYYIFLEKNGRSYNATYKVIDAVSSDSAWTDIRLDNDSS